MRDIVNNAWERYCYREKICYCITNEARARPSSDIQVLNGQQK